MAVGDVVAPGVGDSAGDGLDPGDPLPPGDPDGLGASRACAEPMMSEAGVMPGGPFWIEANAAVVPRTATTATSGTTSRSSTLTPSGTRSSATTYKGRRQPGGVG